MRTGTSYRKPAPGALHLGRKVLLAELPADQLRRLYPGEGVGSVAIALRNSDGDAVAAVAVAIPMSRLTPQTRAEVLRALQEVVGSHQGLIG